ncbi:MAG TPA: hypothetical protein VGK58_19585 [Lacipirellulaceae bacterium]
MPRPANGEFGGSGVPLLLLYARKSQRASMWNERGEFPAVLAQQPMR